MPTELEIIRYVGLTHEEVYRDIFANRRLPRRLFLLRTLNHLLGLLPTWNLFIDRLTKVRPWIMKMEDDCISVGLDPSYESLITLVLDFLSEEEVLNIQDRIRQGWADNVTVCGPPKQIRIGNAPLQWRGHSFEYEETDNPTEWIDIERRP